MKKCPYCAEEIQDDALKCRFCGEFMKKKRWWKDCLIGCLITFLVSIVLLYLFFFFSFLLLKFIIYKVFFAPAHPGFPYLYPPFLGPGLENMFRDFGEFFRMLWQKLMEFLHIGMENNTITF